MININNKSWDKLRASDILKFLSGMDDETFFFEFKSDDESTAKLVKEISAFSNTYGGYIFLGVNDDKTIGGCQKWTEQRIHTTIHDSLTPIPNFDVKKFKVDEKFVLVVKVEEGMQPPYITNKGEVYERVSSGSFPIKDSAKLAQLYSKRQDQLIRTKKKIELEPIKIDRTCPNNLCGYLDIGFSLTCTEPTILQKNFYRLNLEPISDFLKSKNPDFSISRIGHSFLITVGKISVQKDNGEVVLMNAGLNNFIEIMCDGSVKLRIILYTKPGETKADISYIGYFLNVFSHTYSMLLGKNLHKIFVCAQKYESLTVTKQFTPHYAVTSDEDADIIQKLELYSQTHQTKYGNNLIVEGSRLPANDYYLIDKRWFNTYKLKYNQANLIDELFLSSFANLGYIDQLS